MTLLAHPGPGAPRAPRVTVEAPDAWSVVPAGAGLLRARGPGSAEEPVELAVRHHTAPEGHGARALLDEAATAPEGVSGEVEDAFVVELAGREWHARNVSWDDAAEPVVEVHLTTDLGAGGAGVDAALHVVGRVRGAAADRDYDLLQSVLETLVVAADDA